MHALIQSLRIVLALLRRDIYVMGSAVRASLIDGCVQASALAFLQGYLCPALGMPTAYIGTVCVGSLMLFLLVQTSNLSFRMQADIAYGGFTRYQLTLPLSKNLLLVRYVVRFALQNMFTSLPTLIFTLILLSSKIENLTPRPFLFLLLYPLVLVTIASLLLSLGLFYDFQWLRANLWRRWLDPLLMLSTTFFSWQAAYAWSPKLAYALLINPITNAVELVRALLLHHHIAPPMVLHIGMLLMTIAISYRYMCIGLKRRLDPV